MRVLRLDFAVPVKVAQKWKESVPVHPSVSVEAGGKKLLPFRGWLLHSVEDVTAAEVRAARKAMGQKP